MSGHRSAPHLTPTSLVAERPIDLTRSEICDTCSYCPEGYTQIECEEFWADGGAGETDTLPTYRELTDSEWNMVQTAIAEYIYSGINDGCWDAQDALSSMNANGQIGFVADTTLNGAWDQRLGDPTNMYDGVIVIEHSRVDLNNVDYQDLAQRLVHEVMHVYLGLIGPDSTTDGDTTYGAEINAAAIACTTPEDLRMPTLLHIRKPSIHLGGAL